MSFRVFLSALVMATLVGCGSSRDGVPLAPGSNGVASIAGTAIVGETLSASVSDADGVQSGTETYQWYSDGDAITGATSSTYTLTQDEGGESVTVVVRYTDDNGLRETVESTGVTIQSAFALGALYVHGLVDGADCEIAAVDATGAVGAVLGSGTTAGGSVSFGSLVPIDGAALIFCTGGTYTDEATGLTLDAPDTRAVVDVDADTVFTVSPLTEIATQLALAAGDLNSAITTFNNSVGINFGVFGDITRVAPTNLATTAAGNDEAGRYATALALISQVDATDGGATASEVITSLSTDLADGTFQQSSLDAFNQAVIDLGGSPVAGNLDSNALLTVQSAINNAPEPAVFDGLSATIPNDQVAPLTGNVTVTDVNFGEDRVVAQTDTATTYGTFSIAENGAWTYTLDTTDPTVSGLAVGESVNDVVALTSVDGTAANLVIRITALTQVAEIRNTTNGDTGELRLNVDPHMPQGSLRFSFLKTDAIADDGNEKDAYVTLYGASGSVHESLVDLRIQGQGTNSDGSPRAPRFLVRNTDSASYPDGVIEAPFNPNEWYDIEMIWDMSQTNQVTILINGVALGGGPFASAVTVDPDCPTVATCIPEGVERVQWRFGDNGTVIPFGSFFVDNVEIYSDTGATTLVFSDDFENFFVGDSFTGSMDYPDSVDATVAVYDVSAGGGATPAAFFNLDGSIDSDDTDVLMGTVNIIDPDPGENMAIEQTDVATTYGTFSIQASGDWQYTLDTTDPTIAALLVGEFETDTIGITSVDGSTADVVITILGVIETGSSDGLGSPGNKFANITDVAGTSADAVDNYGGTQPTAVIAADDTGELRIDLGSSNRIVTGRMTFQMYKGTEVNTGVDGFVLIGGVDTGSNEALLDLRLDQSDNHYDIRNGSTAVGTYNTDTIYDVEIGWDASLADAATPPTISVTIDGVPLFSGASSSTNLTEAAGGVRYIQFRVADNDDISRADFRVDELYVYETIAGVESVKFSDNYEAYTTGHSLDPNADNAGAFTLAQTPSPLIPSEHNDNSFSVTVGQEPGAGLGTPGNKFANVTDVAGTSADAMDNYGGSQPTAVIAADDTGELRIDLGSSSKIVTGRMTFQMYKGTEVNTGVDGFVLIGGVDTGSNEALLDLRLDQSDNHYDIRNGSTAVGTYNTDTVYDVEIGWDASAADASTPPTISVAIDGVSLFSGASSSTNLTEAADGVRYIQFRVADGDDISRADFRIDELYVYETISGVESVKFSDDYEAYTTGHSLDPNADNAGTFTLAQTPSPLIPSEHNDNSFSVTVGQETGGLGTPGNKFANVTDVAGTSADAMDDYGGTQPTAVIAADDTGELRIDLGSSSKIVTGRMTFQMYKGTEVNTGVDGFVLIGGVDTGSNEALLDLRLDQSDNHYDIRNGSTAVGTYNTDTIYEIEISWDASTADASTPPTISVTIDGVSLFSGFSSSTNLTEAADGVRYIQFRVADNDDITRADFRIDELYVYETIAGVESVKFSDDYEAYTTGDSLDPNADNAGAFTLAQTPSPLIPSEHNDNSFSVTVGEE